MNVIIIKKTYSAAQYCLNGHPVVTNMQYPELKSNFCPQCGAETITECPKCHAIIRGDIRTLKDVYMGGQQETYRSVKRPSFCHNCGNAYPWTERALSNLKYTLNNIKDLSASERDLVLSNYHDILTETTSTPIAAERFNKVLSLAGNAAYDFLIKFASDFGCTMFLKLIGIK